MPKLDPIRPVRMETLMPEPYPCEHCDQMRDHGFHHSFIIGLNIYSRTQGYTYKQCDTGEGQHFACCHDHAVELVLHCLQEHDIGNMPPFFNHPCIFSSCAICKQDIGDTGYRYTLTYAQPGYDTDGNQYSPYLCEVDHWCCSEAHAAEAAAACLEEHLAYGPHG